MVGGTGRGTTSALEGHARIVRQARHVRGGLLSDVELERLRSRVDALSSARARGLASPAEGSRRASRLGGAARCRTARSYRSYASSGVTIGLAQLEKSAEEARQVLKADAERREPVADLLDQERDALDVLGAAAVAQVRQAIEEGELPVWLIWALGLRPNRVRNAEAWLQAAVRLVVFRLVWRVADPVLPFGSLAELESPARAEALELMAVCEGLVVLPGEVGHTRGWRLALE